MIAAPDLRVIRYRIIRVAAAPPALLARLPVVPRRQRGCHLYIAATKKGENTISGKFTPLRSEARAALQPAKSDKRRLWKNPRPQELQQKSYN
jgi:hypothetical protein